MDISNLFGVSDNDLSTEDIQENSHFWGGKLQDWHHDETSDVERTSTASPLTPDILSQNMPLIESNITNLLRILSLLGPTWSRMGGWK